MFAASVRGTVQKADPLLSSINIACVACTDYVLVWEEEPAEKAKEETAEQKRRKRFRERFIEGLRNEQVAIEQVRCFCLPMCSIALSSECHQPVESRRGD